MQASLALRFGGDTGVAITEGARAGQNIFGMAFAITDLVDAAGVALTNSTVIMGLDFDAPGVKLKTTAAAVTRSVWNPPQASGLAWRVVSQHPFDLT